LYSLLSTPTNAQHIYMYTHTHTHTHTYTYKRKKMFKSIATVQNFAVTRHRLYAKFHEWTDKQ